MLCARPVRADRGIENWFHWALDVYQAPTPFLWSRHPPPAPGRARRFVGRLGRSKRRRLRVPAAPGLDIPRPAQAAHRVAREHEGGDRVAVLGGLGEPAPRFLAVGFDIVSAAMERAECEHRPRVPSRRGAQEPAFRNLMIARHAAAVHVELGQRHLRFGHAGLGGAGEPGGGLGVVLRHAAALGEHAAVPVLCAHHALGRAFQPEGGTLVVTRHTDALGEADSVVERGDQIALLRRALEPFVHGRRLMREGGDRPHLHERREIGLGTGIAGFGRALEPGRRLVRILSDAGAGEIQRAECARSGVVPALGRGAEPMRRLDVVRGQVAAAGIDIAKQCRRLAVAAKGRAAQPAFAVQRIGRSAAPLQQHQTEPHLRAGEPGLGRNFVMLPRLRLVHPRSDRVLGTHAEQEMRSGQTGLRRADEFVRAATVFSAVSARSINAMA